VGAHRLSAHEAEVVLASTTTHAPVFTVDEQSIYRAGYALDEAATAALRERREAAVAKGRRRARLERDPAAVGVGMIAVGSTLKRKADRARFRLIGVDHANGEGRYVFERLDAHEAPVALTPAETRRLFGAAVEEPPRPDAETARTGWAKLADAFGRNLRAAARRRAELGPTPEAQLEAAALGTSAAKRVAESIFADADKLADFEAGLLPTHPAVHRHLGVLIEERDRKEPVA